MSNQQNGYPGQSPYGQPQYGGGYPPPPPPPKGGNKTMPIVFSVVVVLVVLGAGIFVVSRFTGGSEYTAGTPTSPSASRPTDDRPSETPTTGGSPSSQPSQPASPSAPAACNGCFPGITVTTALAQLKAKGYACKEDNVLGIECARGKLEIGIDRDYKLKNQIANIDVGGRASGQGEYPQGPKEALATLKVGLAGVLPIFIADAAVRQQIVTFAANNAGHAASGPSVVMNGKAGGYRLSCHGVSGATIAKNGRSASSYSTSVNIYGPSSY